MRFVDPGLRGRGAHHWWRDADPVQRAVALRKQLLNRCPRSHAESLERQVVGGSAFIAFGAAWPSWKTPHQVLVILEIHREEQIRHLRVDKEMARIQLLLPLEIRIPAHSYGRVRLGVV